MSDSMKRDRKVREDERSNERDMSDPSTRSEMNAWVPIAVFGVGLLFLILYGFLTS